MRPELDRTAAEIEKVITGKRDVIEKILTALLADGHVLLDDVPGVGKTTLAAALSRAVGLERRRVQFTPDVMPSDLVGFSMYRKERDEFEYRPGALNGIHLLLADEINRASGRTQSALLEAMEERRVTVDGRTFALESPFFVIATQNSVGTEGTRRLPYAQMDRFLVRLRLGYPDREAQMALLRERREADPLERVEPVLTRERLMEMQREVRQTVSGEEILDYITRLTLASREHPAVEIGISPRGALFLERTARARAWAEGRDYVTGSDVREVFRDVCAHRILMKESAADRSAEDVAEELLERVENPDRHSRPAWMRRR